MRPGFHRELVGLQLSFQIVTILLENKVHAAVGEPRFLIEAALDLLLVGSGCANGHLTFTTKADFSLHVRFLSRAFLNLFSAKTASTGSALTWRASFKAADLNLKQKLCQSDRELRRYPKRRLFPGLQPAKRNHPAGQQAGSRATRQIIDSAA